jgi:hypothetical protein
MREASGVRRRVSGRGRMVGSASSWKVDAMTQLDQAGGRAAAGAERSAEPDQQAAAEFCSDERFGTVFFGQAVTAERVLASLGGQDHRFHADVSVGLKLTARAAEPLRVVIGVEPSTRRDVMVSVDPEGLRATMLQRVAGIEIQRYVATYIAREITKPQIKRARDIDAPAHTASA